MRILSSCGAVLIGLGACQVQPVAIVDCRTDADCDSGETCTGDRRCVAVPDSASPDAERPDSGSPELVETDLVWDDAGHVAPAQNPFGLSGGWYMADDCAEPKAAMAAGTYVCPPEPPTPACCTSFDPAYPGTGADGTLGVRLVPVGEGQPPRVCTKGHLSQLLPDTTGNLAYGVNWGAGLSFTFNDFGSFDATQPFPGGPVVGFRLDIETVTGVPARAGVVAAGSVVSYGFDLNLPHPVVTLLFDEALPPTWAPDPPPLDRTHLGAVGFTLSPSPDLPEPFEFCITHLRVLQEAAAPSP